MTQPLLFSLIAVLLAIAFLMALAVYSLRGFSRSRLNDVCTRLNRQSRFGSILKHHEVALFVIEWGMLLVTLVATALLFGQRDTWMVSPHSPASWTWIITQALLLIGLYSTLLCIAPWCIARVAGESYLCRIWPVVSLLHRIARPLLAFVDQVDKFTHRLSGREQADTENGDPIAEEIRSVVDEGQREGLLESAAGTMIQRVMDLQSEDSANVMTPRTDMFTISADATLEQAREQLLTAGHTRVPVIGESTDDIVGILYAKDLLKYQNATDGQSVGLRQIVREPFYVPETIGIDDLLDKMKRQHVHMAIVLDEYGGVAGLVTMEDILEEIVGEITDEYDTEAEAGIKSIQANIIEVAARIHIDDLNEQFNFDLPEEGDYDTIGGFVFSQLERVPQPGDDFTWQKLRVTVLEADKRSIKRLKIEVDETLVTTAEEA